ncbi:MAG: MMPL family transporter [Ilumatobacteraceae bacterium]
MGLPIGVALFGLDRLGARLVGQQSHLDARLHLGDGGDDRPRGRHRLRRLHRHAVPEGLKAGLDVEDAVVDAIDTSGRAVLFAGITVVISLMGLFLMGLDFVQGIALASSAGVLMMMAGSLTLLPALLGWVGRRIDHTTWAALGAAVLAVFCSILAVVTGTPALFMLGLLGAVVVVVVSFFVKPLRRLVPPRHERPREQSVWYRWSRVVQRRPWPAALGAVGLLVVLALPLFAIRLGFGDYGNYPRTRRCGGRTTSSPRASGQDQRSIVLGRPR